MLGTQFTIGAAKGVMWGDAIFLIISFVLLLILIRIFAWKPLMDMMKKREEHIAAEIDNAENARVESAAILEEQRQALKAARVEAHELIDSAKHQGVLEREKIVAAAKEEATRLYNEAKADINSEREKAVAEVRGQVANLSVLIASKVIEKNLNEADQSELVASYIDGLGDTK
ncbi:ATP synthase (subunit b, component F0) [Brochothrix thermosphacta]|uniref:ATP synthase subunit b n=2 Tax=Brochothrix thermosphacta TaxID=2756 RepID=A0A2X0QP91_BROTH|nr:F0F1 ATP synthase subunit B [Brochothrix thermosphacta DSM 20171 = FSL F6-1036]SLM91903.1 ATP synthase F0 sector subunit b [Brachybacterium faecium]SOC24684.1 ATP synthase (subunit b, component F0) [Brochothrix thermosphacta]SPN75648.1 ATP synthase (subunit b, component F0) [Brochothrix thermosphacta]SPP30177.1 ATP synthase (subunit b, component F0) [Brochothrix thermosphacta]